MNGWVSKPVLNRQQGNFYSIDRNECHKGMRAVYAGSIPLLTQLSEVESSRLKTSQLDTPEEQTRYTKQGRRWEG